MPWLSEPRLIVVDTSTAAHEGHEYQGCAFALADTDTEAWFSPSPSPVPSPSLSPLPTGELYVSNCAPPNTLQLDCVSSVDIPTSYSEVYVSPFIHPSFCPDTEIGEPYRRTDIPAVWTDSVDSGLCRVERQESWSALHPQHSLSDERSSTGRHPGVHVQCTSTHQHFPT
ncbi:hypothetical protein BCR34DRAFT_324075 [Clohesyomyces aquaticus]|uniref:Uncharacterized protein n=1 Tax=Clohesyomyces aquaticus TaxID=1231657 RepID=A0A1Y1ZMT6_9PLEO|nr:hypothetical protein BCR34DRAFT_324075 [Clohesyomyces aquaticus]